MNVMTLMAVALAGWINRQQGEENCRERLGGLLRHHRDAAGRRRFEFSYTTGSTHPMVSVSWYDCVKWCNARSEREGKTPVYYTGDAQASAGEWIGCGRRNRGSKPPGWEQFCGMMRVFPLIPAIVVHSAM